MADDREPVISLHETRVTLVVVTPASPLSALVSRAVVGVGGQTTLAGAAEVMRAAGVSALLVDDTAGVVTEHDLTRALAAGLTGADSVASVASRHPVVVPGSMTVVEAAGLMLNEHVRHLVVELEGGRTGVTSMRDILAVLLQAADPHLWLSSLRAVITPSEAWLG
ncbi:MAG TPA: CBS domain-containing protein [Acidimicrobiales bacterium]|nr:CBS domain-containing protein [Acidimicrobiales bacterium]